MLAYQKKTEGDNEPIGLAYDRDAGRDLGARRGPVVDLPHHAEISGLQPPDEDAAFSRRPIPLVRRDRRGMRDDTLSDDAVTTPYLDSIPPARTNEPLFAPTPTPTPAPPRTHLDILPVPGSEKRLIHHWVTFTSGKLVLLDESHNPCRSLMLPMALRGLTSGSDSSNADIGTFHAICACAAFNLYELGGRAREQDYMLALHHEEEAIRHLRTSLSGVDQHLNQSFAMAIMACITIEAISGRTCRWRMHVAGGIAYLERLQSSSSIASDFQSHIVSMAILCGYELLPKEYRPDEQARGSKELPEMRELDAFELQLYLDFPAGSSKPGLSKKHSLMVHHMAQAFYYATLVFFKGSAGSIMMWPALVLSAECGDASLQKRVLGWFGQKQKLGFRNLAIVKDMVRELWDRRAKGEEALDWRDLINEERFDVFRL
ncbi:unnamed protein product [Parascedosporium putredinis]|uniref:Uncharacterized protein n=1 Tax=Parascedosporium putredinis TaxID=1442378 RepID=A0A9P1M9S1_9PEZI|nr:unnamed protein product [Parascedosporium putredinis]CAI7992572.1 unnamed protein product [Parascedosporium putredinis]